MDAEQLFIACIKQVCRLLLLLQNDPQNVASRASSMIKCKKLSDTTCALKMNTIYTFSLVTELHEPPRF
ncbi:uncharacterized protein PHALS_08931 [Plasmopara halstedii]|uniref:Uncharacterized protein n=1 Tax=Plasmopara halstedii TaxID=4781 RepID=A0A0P1AEC2_PLAHL|nr:uncharacterized protein PHALS_08931 [Plasmopara halstedii]CEG38884.1 hypothetical protein PHALS_08931 [Plasmopara halstedii]|eukprot:XP_024575253.1 hypothetical protein PHALS_08931 [Plasmopara halstedii]